MTSRFQAIAIGTSAGGMAALRTLLSFFTEPFPLSILVVQHLGSDSHTLAASLQKECRLRIKDAEDKEKITPGVVYVAPPDYHILVEKDRSISLSVDDKINFSRPSIDVLFQTAAIAYGNSLVGVILTGANEDGAEGALEIQRQGGEVIVQAPWEAEVPFMPQAALSLVKKSHVLHLNEIGDFLVQKSRQR